MIEINLLPPEMRKVDRTSLRRLLCLATAAVLVSGSALGLALSAKRYVGEKARRTTLTEQVARLEPIAKEYDQLQAELQEIETRISTISDIRATRLRWGMKLDQLYAVLPEYVWFEEMELKQARGRIVAGQPTMASMLTLNCLLAGADEKRYAEFRRILMGEVLAEGPFTGEQFFAEFDALGYSGWTREDYPATEEGVALKFDLELTVKPLTEPAAAPAKATRPVVAAK